MAEDLAHRAAVAIENARLYRELREADRRKDEFLATLAHELRNPLAPIRNALQILKMPRVGCGDGRAVPGDDGAAGPAPGPAGGRPARRVPRHARQDRAAQGAVELATVVARAVETVQPLIEAPGTRADGRRCRPSRCCLDADPVRLAQVVGNLLNNAAKYTEPDGRIWLTARAEGGEVVLRVRDTGIGIAAGHAAARSSTCSCRWTTLLPGRRAAWASA